MSPPERECETVLECGYSKILESRFFVSGTCILDSNLLRDSGLLVLYSRFHQHKFPRFWNLDCLKKDDNLVDTVNFFTPTVMGMSFLHAISNSSVYNTKLLNRNKVFLIPWGEGGTFAISGWGCAAGTLESLTYTRASSAEFCYPILE